MAYSKSMPAIVAFILCMISLSSALTEQVLSTFIYTHHGERTPMIWANNPSLTPLGAQQLYQAGVNMRNRYVLPSTQSDQPSFTIRGISSIFLENPQLNILSSADEWNTASAQAFMQGLFPPLTYGQNYTDIQGESDLANGTNIVAPLGGYQYPNIGAASSYDYRSIYVKGTDNCPQYNLAMISYYNTTTYEYDRLASQDFYDSLKAPFLSGVFDDSAIGYFDAYYIWDYLNYGYTHNITIARKLSIEDYTRARILAGNWMFDMYANSSSTGAVGPVKTRAIAGRTLANYIVTSFLASIQTRGAQNKMNIVFGDYKPMMSFAALAGLMTQATGAFFNAPLPGSSMMFELFTFLPQNATSSYPRSTDMYVRFLYQNSTDSPFVPVEYSLFGRSPSQAMMSWGEFVSAMGGIMVTGTEDWCQACGSSSVFCSSSDSSQNSFSSNSNSSGLRPVVAGVVGAVVALAAIALAVVLAVFLGGVRFYRQSKRSSDLGGFKGSEKLASDRDLTMPKGGAGATVHEEHRGHERVGSWELKEPANQPRVQSGIDTAAFAGGRHSLDHDDTTMDPYAVPVKPRDTF